LEAIDAFVVVKQIDLLKGDAPSSVYPTQPVLAVGDESVLRSAP
jgi:hypothetical protein